MSDTVLPVTAEPAPGEAARQVAAVLAWCDIADELGTEALHTSTIRLVIAAASSTTPATPCRKVDPIVCDRCVPGAFMGDRIDVRNAGQLPCRHVDPAAYE